MDSANKGVCGELYENTDNSNITIVSFLIGLSQ